MVKNMAFFSKNSVFGIVSFALIALLAGCAKEKRKDQMNAEELSGKAFECVKKKRREQAIGYLEQIMVRFPDNPQIAKYKILLAEMYFKEGKYAAAQELYEHFNQFYPANKRVEYAKYKSILSMFYQTLAADCDQSATEETVKLCQEYLENDSFNQYTKGILDIQQTCQNRLIDKEIYVFNFYRRQNKYDAARNRLKTIRDKYLACNPTIEARLLYLECKLAQQEKMDDVIAQNITTLLKKHPDSQFTRMAQALTVKNSFVF